MKMWNKLLLTIIIAINIIACKKESFITSKDALLGTSVDTLHYDTVFTAVGSITQSFKIFNPNSQKLRLSTIQLMGGSSSFFKINVDGSPGTNFSNVEINANDSLYVFVNVTINPTASNLPFIVQDSIKINYNGNTKFVQLDAFGQNANFLRSKRITTDTTWTNTKPFVILGSISIDSAKTLTIQKGTKIYFHADAPMIVNGTLKAIGEKFDSTRINFKADRLDNPYNNFPGSWPGIFFTKSSVDNIMQFCNLLNAYQGTIVQSPSSNANAKLTLQECMFTNIYDIAIGGSNTSITAKNCLIANAGYNIYLTAGGNYNFTNCTAASYSNLYLAHKTPVLTISNTVNAATTNAMNCNFKNCIFYAEGGLVDDEIIINKQGTTAFTANFDNVLYKMKNADPTAATFSGTKLKNSIPIFDSINNSDRVYNFRLAPTSPCINKGSATSGITIDLDGNNRNIAQTDLGCYEKQ